MSKRVGWFAAIVALLALSSCKTQEDAPDPVPEETTFHVAVIDDMTGAVYKTVQFKGFANASINVSYSQLAGDVSGLEPDYFVILDGSPTSARLGYAANNPNPVSVLTSDNTNLKAYVLESGAPYSAIGLGGELGVPQGKTGKRVNFDGQTPKNEYENEVFQDVFGQVNGALSGYGFDTGCRVVGSLSGDSGAFVYGCAKCYGDAGWHGHYSGHDRTILFNTQYGLTHTGMLNVTIAEAVELFTMSNNPGNVDLGTGGRITEPAVKLLRAKALFAPK